MIGAIIGDIIGSRFEHRNTHSKEFELFHYRCHPTDDSIMTIAVAQALMDSTSHIEQLGDHCIRRMQEYGRKYPDVGYGRSFYHWIFSNHPEPYNSWGNGSAMRVSPCGWVGRDLTEVLELAEITGAVTHNHPEGIKGAQAAAACVYLARTGKDKSEISDYIQKNYYPLNFMLDDIRYSYKFDSSCMGSVPQAIKAFIEGEDFEDVIRKAISIGGDSDTIAAIAGGIAEAYYGIDDDMRKMSESYLDHELMSVIHAFEDHIRGK